MSATARIEGAGSGRWLPPRGGALGARAIGRWLTGALVILLVFLGAGILGLGLYASAHRDRIYEGVVVADVPVGGLSHAEARAALDEHFAAYAARPLTLVAGDQTFSVTPAAVGATLDGEATVAAAFAYGRSGSLWERSRAWVRGFLRGAPIPPRVQVDPAAADAQLRALAPAIVRAPTDATIEMGAAGQPTLVADVPGIRLDYGASRAALVDRIVHLAADPVPIVTRTEPAAIAAASLAPSLPAARAAVDAPLVLGTDEGIWHVAAADLKRIVSVEQHTAELRIDRRPLVALVERLAAEIDRVAVDAGLRVDADGALAVVPSVAAAEVDVEATVAAIETALLAGEDDVALVVARAPPAITDEPAAAAAARGEAMIAGGMDLVWNGGRARLGRNDLLRALTIQSRPGTPEPFVFGLDEATVADLLAPIAEGFDRPARDARFRLVDGQLRLVADAAQGRALDPSAGVAAIVATFGPPDPEARLTVTTLEPRFTAADLDQIRLDDDILAEASTYYGQSSEPRRRNVERAVELETGWLVPPGGVFSFVESLGALDQESGFVTGFGIIATEEGGVTTAPVIGGGVCQVSTTLFQAAFWAGLPIEERWQHPYYLRSYGEAPMGLPGLDAMVNVEESWSLDLKFRNATDDWMVVLLTADGETVSARLVGTAPGWEVQVDQPEISAIVRADDRMHTTDSPELPRGQDLLVESAEDGFDVTIARTVLDNGQVIDEYAVSSSFAPSRNLTLRGTG